MSNIYTATFDADILSDVLPNIDLSSDHITLDLSRNTPKERSIHPPTAYADPNATKEGSVWHRLRFDENDIESIFYVYHNKQWHRSLPNYIRPTDSCFEMFFYTIIQFIEEHNIHDYSLYLTESTMKNVYHIGEGFFTSDLKENTDKNNITFTQYFYNTADKKIYTQLLIKLHTEWVPVTEPVEMSKDHKDYKKCCERFGVPEQTPTKGIDLHLESDSTEEETNESAKETDRKFSTSSDVFTLTSFDLYRSTIVAWNLKRLLNEAYFEIGADPVTAASSLYTTTAAFERIASNLFTSDIDQSLRHTLTDNSNVVAYMFSKLENTIFTVPHTVVGNDKLAYKTLSAMSIVNMLTQSIPRPHKRDIVKLRKMVNDIHTALNVFWNTGDDPALFREYEDVLLSIIVPVLHSILPKKGKITPLHIDHRIFLDALSDTAPWWTKTFEEILEDWGMSWSKFAYKLFKTF